MGLLIIACILTIVSMALLALILAKKKNKSNERWLLLALPFLWFAILLFGSFTKVNANEVGIIYDDRDGVQETVKYEGFQTKSIFEHITKIETINKTAALEVAGQTSDSAYATVIITIIYRIDAENAGKFFKRTSADDISYEQLNSIAKEALQSSTIKYDIYAILGVDLENVRLDFAENLAELLMERYYITLVSCSFDDVDAGERIENIIKNKAEALQQIEIAEAQKQQAEVDKQTAIIKAEAEAEVIKIEAQAEADKIEVEKQASSDAIKVYTEELGITVEEAIKLYQSVLYYGTWNGELPNVITNDNVGVMVPMPE